ncbi:MAG TPA: V-type ATP synthase subunit E family protein [Anaerolineales bacterium]|jgi:V-type H+-transporting ATPase subunit E|nr:V-type ATP synthase subunit E family protein [Anaerolineales bacterium]
MNSEAENIVELERAILIEAREEAEQMQVEAKEKADAIHKRAQDQAESERKALLDRAREDADRLRSQATATAQLKARSSQLEHREKVLDNVFTEVKKQLDAVKKRPEYDAIAALLLREALTQLRVNKAEIRADESTQKSLKKSALDEIAKELKGEFTIGGGLDEGTGVIVDASGGKIHYDNTLETRLSRLQSTLRASVYKVLMGE